MPLERQIVSIPLAVGQNEKIDSKILQPGKLASIRDCVIRKLERLEKRFGFVTIPTSIQNQPPTPISIVQGLGKSALFEHDEQLVLQNNGYVYSLLEDQQKWQFKNSQMNVAIENRALSPIGSNDQIGVDSGTAQGVTVVAWVEPGRVFPPTDDAIWYSAYEEATGNVLTQRAFVGFGTSCKVVAFSSSVWIARTYVSSTGPIRQLLFTPVNLTTGVAGSETTLATDLSNLNPAVDFCVTSGGVLGEVAAFAYAVTGAAAIKFGFVNTSGAVLGTPAVATIADTLATTSTPDATALSVHIDPAVAPNRAQVAWFNSARQLRVQGYTWTASVLTAAYGPTTVDVNARGGRIAQAVDPNFTTETLVFYEEPVTGIFSNGTSVESKLYFSRVNQSGSVLTSAALYGAGYQLVAKPIKDTVRNTIYLICAQNSVAQGTLFLLDVLKGKADGTTFAQAKFAGGLANGFSRVLSEAKPIATGSTKYALGVTVKAQATTVGASASGTFSAKPSFRLAASRYVLDLSPSFAASGAYLAQTTHIAGGFLGAYDGSGATEQGFFIDPEYVFASANNSFLTVTTSQVGTGALQNITDVVVNAPGWAVRNTYVRFYVPGGANYVLWFNPGSSSQPVVGGVTAYIEVTLIPGDLPFDIASKASAAINAFFGFVNVESTTGFDDARFTIRNVNVGAVTASAVTNDTENLSSFGLAAGAYQYTVVWKWFDRNGQIVRSAPSVPITVTAVANAAGYAVFAAPTLSNRDVTTIVAEVYRTKVNGTTFFKASGSFPNAFSFGTGSQPFSGLPYVSDIPWASGQTRYIFCDAVPDGSLGELLYTSGGVLENYQIPACKYLTTNKNRVLAAGLEDDQAVFYSKEARPNQPISFAAVNYFRVSGDAEPISGIAPLDDKTLIFKPSSIFLVAGDGANDLGQNSTFTQPVPIPTDVGCANHNSIVPYPEGLLFQSSKGIYKIGRDLSVSYIGAAVENYNGFTVSSATLLESVNEVRFTLQDSSDCLVYNYFADAWMVFSNMQSDSACLWQGLWTRVKPNGKVQTESAAYVDTDGTSSDISMRFETPWLKASAISGFGRAWMGILLGEFKSPHTLEFRVYYDFDETNFDSYTWSSATALTGSNKGDLTEQAEINFKKQKCDAIKVVAIETPVSGSKQSATFSRLHILYGVKAGLNKVAARKSV